MCNATRSLVWEGFFYVYAENHVVTINSPQKRDPAGMSLCVIMWLPRGKHGIGQTWSLDGNNPVGHPLPSGSNLNAAVATPLEGVDELHVCMVPGWPMGQLLAEAAWLCWVLTLKHLRTLTLSILTLVFILPCNVSLRHWFPTIGTKPVMQIPQELMPQIPQVDVLRTRSATESH